MTNNRPRKNIFLARVWPGSLPFAQAGEEMRFYRRIFVDMLGPRQSQEIMKYQDYETKMALAAFCEFPDDHDSHVNRFSLSVTFSAIYGTRISRLDHPVMVELHDIWETVLYSMLQPLYIYIYITPFFSSRKDNLTI